MYDSLDYTFTVNTINHTGHPDRPKEMEMNAKDVIRKIKALLARGDEAKNDNANERAICMRQAQKLMDEYGITQMEAEFGDGSERGESAIFVPFQQQWKYWVAQSLGALYGVVVYSWDDMMVRVGTETNREIHKSMYDYVMDSIRREAKNHTGRGRKYINSFKKGAAIAIANQCQEIMKQRGMDQEKGKGILVLDYYKQEIDKNYQYLDDHGINLRTKPAGNISDPAGMAAGKEYGKGISLNDQIGGETSGGPKLIS